MAKKSGIPGLSFSWKRALGISAAKQRIARKTGIPTTRQGRQRKAGQMAGCMIPMFMFAFITVIIISIFIVV